ncbi:MAG: hypothetical protein ACPGRZ_14505 [Alphaproteobacteria bacterium]
MVAKVIQQNLKPGIVGAAAGAIVLAIVGFNWGGWVTGDEASEMTRNAVVERLVPICVGQYNSDSDKVRKLAELKKVDSWLRGDYVVKQGWATMPGATEADQSIARGCADIIVA